MQNMSGRFNIIITVYRVFPRGSRFPALPCISFSNYVFFYLRPSDLPRRWIQCCKLLRVRRTNGVFRHLIGNMPKSCACTGRTNHNMMGKYLSFYKWPVKTSNQYQREQWLQSIVGSRKQSGLMSTYVCSQHLLTAEPFIIVEILCFMTSSHKSYAECRNSLNIYE